MKGGVSPAGPGRWRLFVDAGTDPLTNRRRRVTRTFEGNKREAEEAAARLVTEVRDRKHGTAARTFGQLLDDWLDHAAPDLAHYTLRSYRSKVEQHIRPALGDVKLKQISAERLDLFYRELRRRGNKRGGGLSAQTVAHIHRIIHRALEQARRWGWLDRNPAEFASPPTPRRRPRDLATIAEIHKVAAELDDDMRDLVAVVVVSGCRRGEACALRWSDIDLTRGRLTIARSAVDTTDGVVEMKEPKSGEPRSMALDPATVAFFGERLARKFGAADLAGVDLQLGGYVFSPDADAIRPLRPQLASKRWANAARVAGVTCRLHDLRHFAITELLEAGFEIAGVSKRAGHAKTSITQDLYQHARRSGDLAASEHLSRLMLDS